MCIEYLAAKAAVVFAAKGRYMWRDSQRICEADGWPLTLPPVRFPQNGLKAARLALVGEAEGWTPAFTRMVFTTNYAEQKDISDEATLCAILSRLGVNAEAALLAARSPQTKQALRTQNEEAVAPGLFGAPSFTVGDEIHLGFSSQSHLTAHSRRTTGLTPRKFRQCLN